MKHQANLVLEGGGMRGAYTAGVLDFFHDKEIKFPLISTTSSAAIIGSSYVSNQRGRNYKILEQISSNKHSISFSRMIRHKELFNMEFIFQKLSGELIPLNFEDFLASPSKLVVGTTDLDTGKPNYHETFMSKSDLLTIIRASCSLPILAPSITYNQTKLMDGGIADNIPIKPSIESGNTKHVVVLTRNKGYIKKATKLNWLFKRVYRNHPEFLKLLSNRHELYNETMQQILDMEKRGEVFIIQPKKPLKGSRIERNREKLRLLYNQGYEEAENSFLDLKHFLHETEVPRNPIEQVSGNKTIKTV
ncbi:Predicted phospholipase, patatin/cPLA2 family [Oceanobacillus limi]|uniref:Predicted phospholipase, patatin/cPLA2 family n=1 Tax=Oceanobacillus limi TaxID=930131 RepID=A0A1I0BAH5_9BACI|nr:patatin family protein [Oceanobacillus limi]SET03092.1 Predicted phospholipase, patatin/cPLA2 family [Oceanobacillus limi]